MDGYVSEQEQLETFKKWWRENGKSVLIGLAAGFILVGASFFWRGDVQEKAEQASLRYDQLLKALEQNNNDAVIRHGEAIIARYDTTTYATLAALAVAKAKTEQNDLTAARSHLQWVIDNSDQEELTKIARLRLGRILLAQNQLDAAQKLIGNSPTADSFAVPVLELKGDILLAKGDIAAARTAYSNALAKLATDDQASRRWLQLKLDNLGGGSVPGGAS